MLYYKFACSDELEIRSRIEQIIANDQPCGKSVFGGNLYKAGIHFLECDEVITGFYLGESENEAHRGSPARVRFSGRFVKQNGKLTFEVGIYPRGIELLFLMFAFLFLSITGKMIGFFTSAVVLFLFGKGYYDMINETYFVFERIFR